MMSKHILLILLIGIISVSLIAAPAAAREVNSGNAIFVYENNINFADDLAGTAQLQYAQNNNVLNTIPVQDSTNFNLLAASVGSYTGSWNAVDTGGNNLGTVMIYYPELIMDIVLAKDGISPVQQSGFLDTEYYKFKISAPQVGPSGVGATVNIVFKGAGGSETTYASGNSFADIPMNSAQVLTTQSFQPGDLLQTTTFYAEWSSPASFHNYAEKSNSITMNYEINPTTTATSIPVPTTVTTTVPITIPTTEATPAPTTETPTPAPTKSPLPLILAPLAVLAGVLFLRK